MENFIKQKLSTNSVDKMIYLLIFCFVITSLNVVKNKENNEKTIELFNIISEM